MSSLENNKDPNIKYYYSNSSLVKYEILKNIFINIIAISVLLTIYYFYSSKYLLLLSCLTIFGAFFDVFWSFRYVKYSKISIYKNTLRIHRGKIFSKHYLVPIKNIYMVTLKNNFILDKLNIVEIKIRTLADNHSFNGLSREDYRELIDVLSRETRIQIDSGDDNDTLA